MTSIHYCFAFALSLFIISCKNDKAKSKAISSTKVESSHVSIHDSIDRIISGYESRLDIKMIRETKKEAHCLTTLQKYLDKGDSSQVIKIRAEILTDDTKLDVLQYHYIRNKLALIHEYHYDKKCDNHGIQCMNERKIYLNDGKVYFAINRNAKGTVQHIPEIENVKFQPFTIQDSLFSQYKILEISSIHQFDSLRLLKKVLMSNQK